MPTKRKALPAGLRGTVIGVRTSLYQPINRRMIAAVCRATIDACTVGQKGGTPKPKGPAPKPKRGASKPKRKGLRRSWDIVVVGARAMQRYNREYHACDDVTDVLAFDVGTDADGVSYAAIIVCYDVARREARARGITLEEELLRYVVHGTLHLLGYRDDTPERRAQMWKLQERLLKNLLGTD